MVQLLLHEIFEVSLLCVHMSSVCFFSIVLASPKLKVLDVSGNVQLRTGCVDVIAAVLKSRTVCRLLMSVCGMCLPGQQHHSAIRSRFSELSSSHRLDFLDASGNAESDSQTEFLQWILDPITHHLYCDSGRI